MAINSSPRMTWLRAIVIALLIEKIIQHSWVTLGFYFNWYGMRSTVAVDPMVLMVLGAIAAVVFAVALWGMLTGKPWVRLLVIFLALFDMIGEFVAKGTIFIPLNVSFIVATLLLLLMIGYRPEEGRL